MTENGRVIILMMDSFGIGAAADAKDFDNLGADTFGHIAAKFPDMKLPNLAALGLFDAYRASTGKELPLQRNVAVMNLPAKYGYMSEISLDKDTTSGHWEMAGAPVLKPWGHFKPDYPSFPAELIKQICNEAGLPGILGNLAASGTEIIQIHGEEHIKTGKPIFYTSADSNIQIAAHEEHFGLGRLYKLCETAFKYAKPYNIARIIARPFIGEKAGEFTRTKNRHDYSVKPLMTTVLDKNCTAGNKVIAIGKIRDIFAGQGISEHHPASGLEEIWDVTLEQIRTAPAKSIIFPNFVDFDMLWGHRRNVEGYARGLEYFDSRLPEIMPLLHEDDIVFITADHGNDPTYRGTDHTRENVPVLMFGPRIKSEFIGHRKTFADISQTIAAYLGLTPMNYGTSFLDSEQP